MSPITNKPKAIIYCAENSISGKRYIGRTLRTLEVRKKEHLTKTIRGNTKFGNALKSYPSHIWVWSILAEVDYEKANEYEKFFIKELDTYNSFKGYNLLPGGSITEEGSPSYNIEICNVYHPNYGLISGTRSELTKMYPELERIRVLITKYCKSLKGWVLSENKDNYNNFLLDKKPRGGLLTLTHSKLGTHTLPQKEFVGRFGLKYCALAHLIKKEYKSHKGWKLIEEKNEKSN